LKSLKKLLDEKAEQYNTPEFIKDDPVQIPHKFSLQQDIEIMGFFAATLAWGQRKTIINKCLELVSLFENAPYDFILNHREKDLQRFLNFKHRTFNATDLLYFIEFFSLFYRDHSTLEDAFLKGIDQADKNLERSLMEFHNLFFSLPDFPLRTRKHIPTPARNSSCKRLNMFLRWMVRNDNKGVDFGIWKRIKPSMLLCPLDVHVQRVSMKLGILHRHQQDWKAVVELTENLNKLDPFDPVKYDFALFGMGINEKEKK
jgi:uncharacterized protein (TIGR02757 family)